MRERSMTMRVLVRGVVQGVGFRPFLYRLFSQSGLTGEVRNTGAGVALCLSGPRSALLDAIGRIESEAPPLARVMEVSAEEIAYTPYAALTILPSTQDAHKNTLIAPDVGICADCQRELLDPADRRFAYPFINCTNCGPRFSIIRDVPYDRKNTAMAAFPMCAACAAEYADVTDRRYHAQPDCCAACGPGVFYLPGAGEADAAEGAAAIEKARACLLAGGIVAVKGIGGLHLACLPQAETVMRLREGKKRDERPLALMCRDVAAAKRLCCIDAAEEALLCGPARPIVLLAKRARESFAFLSENRYLGVMLPYTPLHVLLLQPPLETVVLTSANVSELPMLCGNDPAQTRAALTGIADGFLLHDREIVARCDDSLLYAVDGREYPLRRSRGYAPYPIRLGVDVGGILACGAEQKATFALGRERDALMSQHIGDLKNWETLAHYQAQIARFERLFDCMPTVLACDLHPDLLSTAYAEERAQKEGQRLVRVQHHHAHMAACMADNELGGACLGVIWDGTGYGPDGSIWGGEFLYGDAAGYTRLGSLRPIPLAGGDAAIREIYRVACALLLDAGLDAAEFFGEKAEAVRLQLQSGVNCPLSSGMGRLFDGVYALLSGRMQVSYEGQGAVLLQAMAADGCTDAYPVAFTQEGVRRFDPRPMLRAIALEKRGGAAADAIAARFMQTLAEAATQQCAWMRKQTGEARVVLSGGVFQNLVLLRALEKRLVQDGFTPYHHGRVSCNDEGLALGQLVIAAAEKKRDP